MAHGKTAGADAARCNEDLAVSHAGSCGETKARNEVDYSKRLLRRLLPALGDRIAVEIAEVHPIAPQRCLRLGEALPKPLARNPERVLGIDLQSPRERDHREEQVAQLVECLLRIARLRQLARLLGHVLSGLGRRFEIKPHSRRALLQAKRPSQCWRRRAGRSARAAHMSPRGGRVAGTHESARGPTDSRPARAAWPRPRRWPRRPASRASPANRTSIQILSRARYHDVAARLVQVPHLAQQKEKIIHPCIVWKCALRAPGTLAAHLDAVGKDRNATRHPARQLVDVEVALGVDADDDVVPIGDDTPKAQPLPAQLDPQRVRQVVKLGGSGPVAVFERAENGFQLLLFIGRGELPVSPETQLLVAYVRAWDEVIERQVEVHLSGREDVADRGFI